MTKPAQPIRLYRHALSGHAHRVELFLSLLGLPCELIDVDMVRGAHKAPEFIAKNNPFGEVPMIEDGDIAIADSNAILVYLAIRYDPDGEWDFVDCAENNPHVVIGNETYMLSADGFLMPTKAGQPGPDLRYFKGRGKAAATSPAAATQK